MLKRGRPKGVKSPVAVKYAEIRTKWPTLPKRWAKRIAGYSEGTQPACIEGGEVMRSLAKQRETAIKELGITIRDQMAPLVGIRDKKGEQSSDRISAIKTLNSMIPGYVAAEEKNVKVMGLFMEMRDVSTDAIAEFLRDQGEKV